MSEQPTRRKRRRRSKRSWKRKLIAVAPKLFFGVFAVAALLVVLALALGERDPQSRSKDHLAQAHKHLEAKEAEQAFDEVRAAITLAPNSTLARALYGKMLLASGNLQEAREELAQARNNGLRFESGVSLDDRLKIERDYMRVLIKLGELEQAKAVAAQAPDEYRDDDWRLLEADLYVRLGLFDVARAIYAEQLENPEHEAAGRRGMVRVLLEHGRFREARVEIDTALKRAPKDIENLALFGEVALAQKDFEAATGAFRQVLLAQGSNSGSDSVAAHVGLARAALALGKIGDADGHIESVLSARPNDPNGPYLQAVRARISGDKERAKAKVLEAIGLDSNHARSQLFGAEVYLADGEYEQAEQLLQRYLQTHPNDQTARSMMASVFFGLTRYREATLMLEEMLRKTPSDAQLLAMLATAQAAAGNNNKARESWLEASNAAREDGTKASAPVSGYSKAGAASEAVDVLQEYVTRTGDFSDSATLLVVSHLRAGQPQRALAVLAKRSERELSQSRRDNLRGVVYEVMSDTQRAREAYAAARAANSSYLPALVNLARLEFNAGRTRTAREMLQTAILLDPKHYSTLMKLAEVEIELGNGVQALKLLQTAREENPFAAQPRLLLANYHLEKKDRERASQFAEEALSLAPKNIRVLETAARVRLQRGDPGSALELLTRALIVEPDSVDLLLLSGQAELASGNRGGAKAKLEEALTQDENSHTARSLLARLQAEDGQYEKVLTHGKLLSERLAQSYEGAYLQGVAHTGLGDNLRAVEAFKRAMSKAQKSEIAIGLAKAQRADGNLQAAGQALDKWLRGQPNDVAAVVLRAQVFIDTEQPERALSSLRHANALEPERADILNDMAVLLADKNIARALEMAEKAYESDPESPRVLDTLGWLLVRTKNFERATSMLRRANSIEQNPTYSYHLAVALSSAGSALEAKELLRTLVLNEVEFPERNEARELYRKLR